MKQVLPARHASAESSRSDATRSSSIPGFIILDFLTTLTLTRQAGLLPRMISFIHAWALAGSGGLESRRWSITPTPSSPADDFRALIKCFEEPHGLELDESGINESRSLLQSP